MRRCWTGAPTCRWSGSRTTRRPPRRGWTTRKRGSTRPRPPGSSAARRARGRMRGRARDRTRGREVGRSTGHWTGRAAQRPGPWWAGGAPCRCQHREPRPPTAPPLITRTIPAGGGRDR
ncbi:tRNA-specific 2-thiouridylase, partial [Frankliniella fusca]